MANAGRPKRVVIAAGIKRERADPIRPKIEERVMLRTFFIAALGAAFLTTGPVAVVTSDTAEARTCQAKFIVAYGKRKNSMFGARTSARLAWKAKSRRINGTKYDNWWPSKRKSMKCWTNRAGKKRCRAAARPCTIL